MKNSRVFFWILVFPAVWLLAGCVPMERFWWSPDGEKALVLVEDRLYLTGEDGGWDEVGVAGEAAEREKGRVVNAVWLPDGRGCVVLRHVTVPEWAAARDLLPREDVALVEALETELPLLLRAAVALGGDAEDVQEILGRLSHDRPLLLVVSLLHVALDRPEALQEALTGAPRAAAHLEQLVKENTGYVIQELVRVDLADRPGESTEVILHRGLEPVSAPQVSSRHPVLAYGRKVNPASSTVVLECRSWEDREVSPPQVLAPAADPAFQWTPDGQSLVYLAPVRGGEVRSGDAWWKQVIRTEVLDETGQFLERAEGEPKLQVLASAMIPFLPRVEVFPNGDVLVASQVVKLPTGPRPDLESHLYRVPAEGGEPVRIPTRPGDLPMNLGHFVLSPDGGQVAVVESDSSAVAVVRVSDGRTKILQPASPGWQSRVMPRWRTETELAHPVLDPEKGEVHWDLWSGGGKTRRLSVDWPEGATKGWLVRQRESGGQ